VCNLNAELHIFEGLVNSSIVFSETVSRETTFNPLMIVGDIVFNNMGVQLNPMFSLSANTSSFQSCEISRTFSFRLDV
jgi:hypothetical protein